MSNTNVEAVRPPAKPPPPGLRSIFEETNKRSIHGQIQVLVGWQNTSEPSDLDLCGASPMRTLKWLTNIRIKLAERVLQSNTIMSLFVGLCVHFSPSCTDADVDATTKNPTPDVLKLVACFPTHGYLSTAPVLMSFSRSPSLLLSSSSPRFPSCVPSSDRWWRRRITIWIVASPSSFSAALILHGIWLLRERDRRFLRR